MAASDRLTRVGRLLEEAAGRAAGERGAFLDTACSADASLRREVESLLRAEEQAEEQADGFLRRTPFGRPIDGDASGGTIGPYRLVSKAGEGGMSTVYLAVRADRAFRKQVAIKVLRPEMAVPDHRQRFAAERQILAGLEHPHIARLYDGGTTPDGLPYLVMEWIEGEPITDYCIRRGLSVRQRLGLFRTVCAAVHHAHQNLVVHRDLKPSNVLVQTDGTPKLVDFGIAKLLDPELAPPALASAAAPATRAWHRILTPSYASPEQVEGGTITTASDVYSLGVLLFELLSGRLPFDVEGRSLEEIRRLLAEGSPLRPSDAAARGPAGETPLHRPTDALGRQLAGDLDTIVLKAMSREPERRYPSAEQLSEDLRRHLEGLPVIARRPTFGYRAARFLRRHRIAAAAAGVVLVLLVAAATALALLSLRLAEERRQATRERDRAAAQRDRAERLADSLHGIFELADPDRGSGPGVTAGELVQRAAERAEQQLDGDPEEQGAFLHELGVIHRKLGRTAEAGTLLERALALRRSLGPDSLPEADTLDQLAEVRMVRGDHAEAERLVRRALEIKRKLYREGHPKIAESLNRLAVVHLNQRDFAEAEALVTGALDTWQRLGATEQIEYVSALGNRTAALAGQGQTGRALEAGERAIAAGLRVLGADHPRMAHLFTGVGSLRCRSGDRAAGEVRLREAVALRRRALPPGHWLTAYSEGVLGHCLSLQGRLSEAEELLLSSLAGLRAQKGDDGWETRQVRERLAELRQRAGPRRRQEAAPVEPEKPAPNEASALPREPS